MKKNLFILLGMLTLLTGIFTRSLSASETGALDTQTLQELKNSIKLDESTRALMNAITNNDINKLVLNRQLVNQHNDVFNLKLDVKGITNQKRSGRCWMFAGLNIMRPTARKKFNLNTFEFSEAYLFFWDKLEKANFLLESIIETRKRDIDDREIQALLSNPVPDGGWWNYVVALIEKYGVVPKEIMPETANTSNTRMMNKILNSLVRQYAAELRRLADQGKKESQLRARKKEMLKDVYRLLILHFGTPPERFTWRYEDKDKNIIEKSYTPLEFYHDAVGFDLTEYITLFDYPVHPYATHYQINFCRNMADVPDMDFLNVGIDRLKECALNALKDGEPVWFAADVGWQMERDHGIMEDGIYDYNTLYRLKGEMSKAERILYRASTPNHAMVFVAADTVNGKPVKWRVENSWGKDKGDGGYWTMYDNWFDKYVYTVIVNKKYLTPEELELLKTKPKKLPAWDPMRTFF